MVLRKIVAIIICTLLSPIVFGMRLIPGVLDAIFYGEYKYYDFHITSLKDFLNTSYGSIILPTMIISLLLIFIPFQLTKDYFYRKGFYLRFFKRIGILFGIMIFWIVVSGLISHVAWLPWHQSLLYLVCLGGISLFYTTISHFMVDRYQKNKP